MAMRFENGDNVTLTPLSSTAETYRVVRKGKPLRNYHKLC